MHAGSGEKGCASKANYVQGWKSHRRSPGLAINGQPDLVGGLRGQLMKHQGRKQTDNSVRYPDGGLGEAMVLRNIVPGDGVDAVAKPGDDSVGERNSQRRARQAKMGQLARPNDRFAAQQLLEFRIDERRHTKTMQYVGTYMQVPIVWQKCKNERFSETN